jgi:hypothetical protein
MFLCNVRFKINISVYRCNPFNYQNSKKLKITLKKISKIFLRLKTTIYLLRKEGTVQKNLVFVKVFFLD